MPESKNSFLQGRMNKDLDERLLQDGEYRDARNVSISSSETGNSGSLENVNGTVELTDFGLTDRALEIIGQFVDTRENRIYAFLTNYNDSSPDTLSNFAPTQSAHYIAYYNIDTNESGILVKGRFLNFSKTHRIISVNIIEDLLFFTDNRNQPRKINVDTAISQSSNVDTNPYYSKEEDISVAKYYPYNAPRLYKNEPLGGVNGYKADLLQDVTQFPDSPTPSTTVNYVDVSGKLSIDIVINGLGEVSSITPKTDSGGSYIPYGSGYSSGDTITVPAIEFGGGNTDDLIITLSENSLRKVSTMRDTTSEKLPLSYELTSAGVVAAATSFDVTTTLSVAELENMIGACVSVKDSNGSYKVFPSSQFVVTSISSGSDITVGIAQIVDGVRELNDIGDIAPDDTIIIGANPDYENRTDPNPFILDDKFVRFAYRFKFDNNEYSLISPFTQIVFIPKQDGYFLGNDDSIIADEKKAVDSSIINFFENKVTSVELQIDMPEGITSASELREDLKVKEIEIVAKFSDDPSIKLIDTLSDFDVSDNDTNVIQYEVNSVKNIRTLPERETTRVYDKVPVRALAQEVVGNRVVYANYLPNHASLDKLDYSVSVSEKFSQALGNDYFNYIEHPNHQLKQNRAYQVGIVLCDKFGRQSDVILSDNSTVYSPFRSTDQPLLTGTDIYGGDSLKLTLNQPIPDNYFKDFYPNLYDADTNPLGWYSYKIVVKQQEQSYYNAYVPTMLNGYPRDTGSGFASNQNLAHITLVGDNINKIPRDLAEVGAQDTRFRSSAEIYPRVVTSDYTSNTQSSAQFSTDGLSKKVTSIGTVTALGLDKTKAGDTYTNSPIYGYAVGSGSNPLVAKVSTASAIGSIGGDTASSSDLSYSDDEFDLNIVETKPTFSNLDIFWETSSTGLISELNNSVDTSFELGSYPKTLSPIGYKLKESTPLSSIITDVFFPVDTLGSTIVSADTSIELLSAKDKLGGEFKDRFTVEKNLGNGFVLRNNYDEWVFRQNNDAENTIDFTFKITNVVGGEAIENIVTVPNNRLENEYPSCNLDGSYLGDFIEASPYLYLPSFSNYIGATITVQNGSLNKQGEGTTIQILDFEYFRNVAGSSGWTRYYNNPNIGSKGVPYVRTIGECVRVSNFVNGSGTLEISRKVRALNTDNPRIWTNAEEGYAYPDIGGASSGGEANRTAFRIKARASDANSSGFSIDFFIRFDIDPFT